MTKRQIRSPHTARAAALAVAVASSLVLTGCGALDSLPKSGKKSTNSSSTSGKSKDRKGKKETISGASSSGGSGGSTGRNKKPCTTAEMEITVTKVSKPRNRVLIEATNTSLSKCYAYGFPNLYFDGAEQKTSAVKTSNESNKHKLSPDRTVYASLRTSSAGKTVRDLSVTLSHPDRREGALNPAEVALPGGSLTMDGDAKVTYWQASKKQALAW